MYYNRKQLILGAAILFIAVLGAYSLWRQPEPVAPAVSQTVSTAPAETTAPSTAPATTTVPAPPVMLERFKALTAQNSDVIGWITIPNTKVDYPVVKSRNNDYYLHRDLNRKEYYPGTLFMDYRNTGDAKDRYGIIYGHNMKDGSMFGTLKKYKKKAFYEANRTFSYSTLYEETKWEIIAAYIAPATLELIKTDFKDDADFMAYMQTRLSKSMYPSDMELKPTDTFLTLITCTYEIKDARFVVHAKRVE